MKIDEIQSLIRFVPKSGVSEIELEMTDFSIKIKYSCPVHEARIVQTPAHETVTNIMSTIQTPVISVQRETISSGKKIAAVGDESKYITVKSPMIGTFYKTFIP